MSWFGDLFFHNLALWSVHINEKSAGEDRCMSVWYPKKSCCAELRPILTIWRDGRIIHSWENGINCILSQLHRTKVKLPSAKEEKTLIWAPSVRRMAKLRWETQQTSFLLHNLFSSCTSSVFDVPAPTMLLVWYLYIDVLWRWEEP